MTKTVTFYRRKGYNPDVWTIGGEVMMGGKCVGEWNGDLNNILFKGGDDSEHYGDTKFKTLRECAKWLVGCGRFDHDYDIMYGAMHYYYNTKTGYQTHKRYLRTFSLIDKFSIRVEV